MSSQGVISPLSAGLAVLIHCNFFLANENILGLTKEGVFLVVFWFCWGFFWRGGCCVGVFGVVFSFLVCSYFCFYCAPDLPCYPCEGLHMARKKLYFKFHDYLRADEKTVKYNSLANMSTQTPISLFEIYRES